MEIKLINTRMKISQKRKNLNYNVSGTGIIPRGTDSYIRSDNAHIILASVPRPHTLAQSAESFPLLLLFYKLKQTQ